MNVSFIITIQRCSVRKGVHVYKRRSGRKRMNVYTRCSVRKRVNVYKRRSVRKRVTVFFINTIKRIYFCRNNLTSTVDLDKRKDNI